MYSLAPSTSHFRSRCFVPTPEAPPDVSDAHLLSADTSTGAASDDTESIEVSLLELSV